MPKVIPDDIKLRAVELLRARTPAAAVVRALWDEFEFKISRPTVQQLAEWNGIELGPQGRPKGIPQPKKATSWRRQLARELAAYPVDPPVSYSEIGEIIGCSRARAHKLATDGK